MTGRGCMRRAGTVLVRGALVALVVVATAWAGESADAGADAPPARHKADQHETATAKAPKHKAPKQKEPRPKAPGHKAGKGSDSNHGVGGGPAGEHADPNKAAPASEPAAAGPPATEPSANEPSAKEPTMRTPGEAGATKTRGIGAEHRAGDKAGARRSAIRSGAGAVAPRRGPDTADPQSASDDAEAPRSLPAPGPRRPEIKVLTEESYSIYITHTQERWSMHADEVPLEVILRLLEQQGGPSHASRVELAFTRIISVHDVSLEELLARLLADLNYSVHYAEGRLTHLRVLGPTPAFSPILPRKLETRQQWTDTELDVGGDGAE